MRDAIGRTGRGLQRSNRTPLNRQLRNVQQERKRSRVANVRSAAIQTGQVEITVNSLPALSNLVFSYAQPTLDA